ncbi:hypothetical protein FNH09_28870 [Streptomyces adustus]|uniref:DUF4232 domain-containing protein n=1 Tax=Streptomyces adustus TaxID=1609272 RepID=A0A5N8VIU7_9ACTN|nr:hypothetical protein [Streptomyces adustus]MPY35111.1 hypothetical protein [Streptomyces adustus]
MRRTTLHRTTVTTLAAATLLLMGCGAQHGGSGGDGSGSPSSSPSATTPSSALPSTPSSASEPGTPSGTPPASPACTSHMELTAADNGRAVCLTRGGQIRLTLDGTRERPWSPVTASGDALKAANPGIAVLPGDAVAAYDAVTGGDAKLTSSRPMCPQHGSPGQMSCKSIEEWTVAVTVR